MEESSGDSSAFSIPGQFLSRPFRQGVWSSSLQEEAVWTDALRSLVNKRGGDCRTRYKHKTEQTPYIEGTEIPKIIHFIWLGPKPIPRFKSLPDGVDCTEVSESEYTANGILWNECMLSWQKHHSLSEGWRIHVWTDKDVTSFERNGGTQENCLDAYQLSMPQMFNSEGFKHAMKNHHYALASDILRLEVLNRFGGTYVDVDYWCIMCLDRMVGNAGLDEPSTVMSPLQFFCGESNTGCLELNNGLMACRNQGHPILWEMMRSARSYCDVLQLLGREMSLCHVDSFQALLSPFLDVGTQKSWGEGVAARPSAMDVIEHTGPGLLTRTVCRWLCDDSSNSTINTPGGDDYAASGVRSCCCDKSFDRSQIMVFPRDVFHPFPNHLRRHYASRVREFIIPGVTIAVHLWGCSWQGDL